MRRRASTALGVLAGSVLLALALPGSAAAAGRFVYFTATFGQVILHDPPGGVCIRVNVSDVARNLTDRTAEVYHRSDCRGEHDDILPGRSGEAGGRSVRFVG